MSFWKEESFLNLVNYLNLLFPEPSGTPIEEMTHSILKQLEEGGEHQLLRECRMGPGSLAWPERLIRCTIVEEGVELAYDCLSGGKEEELDATFIERKEIDQFLTIFRDSYRCKLLLLNFNL